LYVIPILRNLTQYFTENTNPNMNNGYSMNERNLSPWSSSNENKIISKTRIDKHNLWKVVSKAEKEEGKTSYHHLLIWPCNQKRVILQVVSRGKESETLEFASHLMREYPSSMTRNETDPSDIEWAKKELKDSVSLLAHKESKIRRRAFSKVRMITGDIFNELEYKSTLEMQRINISKIKRWHKENACHLYWSNKICVLKVRVVD
jgi:hypothetical protein